MTAGDARFGIGGASSRMAVPPPAVAAAATVRPPPGFRLVAFGRVASTNDEARRLASEGAAAGTVVVAAEQTSGRGRRGRVWRSPPGNLYCSVILRPGMLGAGVGLGEVAQLSFVAALAVGAAVGDVVAESPDESLDEGGGAGAGASGSGDAEAAVRVAFKWPNDVLLGGRKVAGILLEADWRAGGGSGGGGAPCAPGAAGASGAPGGTGGSTASGGSGSALPEWVIVGVGINVASYPAQAQYPATALAVVARRVPTVERVLEAFLIHFDHGLRAWLGQGFGAVRAGWLAQAFGLGRELAVGLECGAGAGGDRGVGTGTGNAAGSGAGRAVGTTVRGRFVDLDGDGALVLALDDGTLRCIRAGDVLFSAAPESGQVGAESAHSEAAAAGSERLGPAESGENGPRSGGAGMSGRAAVAADDAKQGSA